MNADQEHFTSSVVPEYEYSSCDDESSCTSFGCASDCDDEDSCAESDDRRTENATIVQQKQPSEAFNRQLDIRVVQAVHLEVEACIHRFLDQDQTTEILRARGYPELLVRLVWRGLEKQNPEFFSRFYRNLDHSRKAVQR